MTGAVAIALTAVRPARRLGVEPVLAVTVTVAIIQAPAPSAAAGFLAWSVARFRRAAARQRAQRELEVAAVEAGELVALALAGGLSVAAAHRTALDQCADPVRPHLARLCAVMERDGVIAALDADSGPTAPVSETVVTATASGAPVLQALEAHIRRVHHARHTTAVEAARRLPIRLLLPLTLLVLPGFVLVTVGPAVMDSLARLGP